MNQPEVMRRNAEILCIASMSNIEDDVDEEMISTPFVIINSEVDEIINPNDIDESQLVENTMIW